MSIAFTLLLMLGSAVAITQAPKLPPSLLVRQDGDLASCQLVNSIAAACSASTSNLFDQGFSVAASCLCYSGSIYQPSIYDAAIETCLAYLSTASPPLYTSLAGSGQTGSPCASVGDVRTNTAIDSNLISCSSWYSMEASCSSDNINASPPPFSIQASCLCYTSSVFAPSVFDGYWDGCLEYYKTASSAYYYETLSSPGKNLNTPCARVGNVRTSTEDGSSSASPGQTISTTPTATATTTDAGGASSTSGNGPVQTETGESASSPVVAVPGAWWLLLPMMSPLVFFQVADLRALML
ncbi:hypothetical protein AYO20_05900 [Fonsecaea nubica]|uniref:Extracellular membrane protein CFEM domain-containing protein n=1 Tax=Fonsecaea nubica TaxID=856822 RepID=A0A178CYL5_9EURO|nr:hypothetical protein AYO20_05900 [Fonsecaea nubica]OAL34939.1 hypothetical protein AYO20_05900 [Fonsecaea nubica]